MHGSTLKTVRWGVGLTAFGASVISVEHVYHFALRIGETTVSAGLLALVLETAIMAGAATVLGWNRAEQGSRPWSGWLLLILGLGGSLLGNVAAASTPDGQIAAAWPPLLTFVGALVLTGLDRREVAVPAKPSRHKKTAAAVPTDKPSPASSRPAVPVPDAKPSPSSVPTEKPSPSPVPAVASSPAARVLPGPAPKTEEDDGPEDAVHPVLSDEDLSRGRALNASYKAEHGKRISRDALKAAGFGTRKATELARVIRAEEEAAA